MPGSVVAEARMRAATPIPPHTRIPERAREGERSGGRSRVNSIAQAQSVHSLGEARCVGRLECSKDGLVHVKVPGNKASRKKVAWVTSVHARATRV